MSQFAKLLLGHSVSIHKSPPAIKAQVFAVLRIWRNYNHIDYGIERIIRLTLASAQFLFPGLYIKHLTGKHSSRTSKLATEAYVVLKLLFPLIALNMGWHTESWVIYLIAYLMAETLLYLASLIYLSDVMQNAIQPHRSLTLLFLNFFEIVGAFALMYAHFDHVIDNFFNVHINSPTTAIYFSFVTAATVGYGDIYPIDPLCQELVMVQITLTFVFVGLFLNFFSSLLLRVTLVNTSSIYRKTRHKSKKNTR